MGDPESQDVSTGLPDRRYQTESWYLNETPDKQASYDAFMDALPAFKANLGAYSAKLNRYHNLIGLRTEFSMARQTSLGDKFSYPDERTLGKMSRKLDGMVAKLDKEIEQYLLKIKVDEDRELARKYLDGEVEHVDVTSEISRITKGVRVNVFHKIKHAGVEAWLPGFN